MQLRRVLPVSTEQGRQQSVRKTCVCVCVYLYNYLCENQFQFLDHCSEDILAVPHFLKSV